MEAPAEASEPIGTDYIDEEPVYVSERYWSTSQPGRRGRVDPPESAYNEEISYNHERADEVHIGPAGAPTAPVTREANVPVAGGAEHAPAPPNTQPVANVAIIAALNNAGAPPREPLGQISNEPVLGDDSDGNRSRSSSISYSEWDETSSSSEDESYEI